MKKIIFSATLVLTPFIAFAQGTTGISNLITSFGKILQQLFPIAIALATLALFFTLIMFIYSQSKGEAEKQATYKTGIIYSLVALTIMLTFFGIIKIIANTLGVGDVIGTGLGKNDIPTVEW